MARDRRKDGGPSAIGRQGPSEGATLCGDRATALVENIWCGKIRGCSYNVRIAPGKRTSGLAFRHVRFVPIVLKKSFCGDHQNFSGPLMPFARGDMRDHIVSHKNDHGASYGRYAVLQRWSRLKISFCEIFGVVQFSTFATLSANSRHRACAGMTKEAAD